MEPEGWSADLSESCSNNGAYLVEDAAIVRRDIVGIEEETFLH